MNNKFSKKVTGLLLISHLTLSALPINAMATEKTDNSSGVTQERIEAPNLLLDSEATQSTENDHTATNEQAVQETEVLLLKVKKLKQKFLLRTLQKIMKSQKMMNKRMHQMKKPQKVILTNHQKTLLKPVQQGQVSK